jgi:tricorn protease-like protein
MIAFNSDRTGEMNIWLLDLESGRSRQITKGSGGDYQATWSPDGKTIAFFSSRAGTADVWCVDVETGELEQLTTSESVNVNPFYSPDGKMIAYNSDQTGRPEVWVMNSDGSGQRQLRRLWRHGTFFIRGAQRETRHLPVATRRGSLGAKTRFGRNSGSPSRELSGGLIYLCHRSTTGSWMSPDTKFCGFRHSMAERPRRIFEFDDPDARIDLSSLVARWPMDIIRPFPPAGRRHLDDGEFSSSRR